MTTINNTLDRRNSDLHNIKTKFALKGIVCIGKTDTSNSPVINPILLMSDDGTVTVELGSYFHGFPMIFNDIAERANELLATLNSITKSAPQGETLELDLFTGNSIFIADDISMRYVNVKMSHETVKTPVSRLDNLELNTREFIQSRLNKKAA